MVIYYVCMDHDTIVYVGKNDDFFVTYYLFIKFYFFSHLVYILSSALWEWY